MSSDKTEKTPQKDPDKNDSVREFYLAVGNTTMKKEETTGAGGGIAASAEHQLTEVASRESEKAMATATANPCLVVRVFEAVQVGRARPQCKPKALETRPETSVPQP